MTFIDQSINIDQVASLLTALFDPGNETHSIKVPVQFHTLLPCSANCKPSYMRLTIGHRTRFQDQWNMLRSIVISRRKKIALSCATTLQIAQKSNDDESSSSSVSRDKNSKASFSSQDNELFSPD